MTAHGHSLSVNYLELLTGPRPHLWIAHDPYGGVLSWRILDGNRGNQLYSRAATFDHAVAFMRAAEARGDVTVDEPSLEHWRLIRAQDRNSLGREPKAPTATAGAVSQADNEPASRPSNVVPIRKPAEPYGESA